MSFEIVRCRYLLYDDKTFLAVLGRPCLLIKFAYLYLEDTKTSAGQYSGTMAASETKDCGFDPSQNFN